jgi:hypothetical protein
MYRRVASKGSSGKLTTAVGDHLVHVHVKLRTATRHPDMQGKHVVMLTRQDLVAGLHDQFVALIVKPFTVVISDGGSLLQGGVGSDHFAGNEIFADAEMLERALCLRSPQLIRRHFNHSHAITLLSHVGHVSSP